jgi:hypothetical protein
VASDERDRTLRASARGDGVSPSTRVESFGLLKAFSVARDRSRAAIECHLRLTHPDKGECGVPLFEGLSAQSSLSAAAFGGLRRRGGGVRYCRTQSTGRRDLGEKSPRAPLRRGEWTGGRRRVLSTIQRAVHVRLWVSGNIVGCRIRKRSASTASPSRGSLQVRVRETTRARLPVVLRRPLVPPRRQRHHQDAR